MMVTVNKYNILLRFLHWIMGVLIIGLVIMGFYMGSADSNIKPFLYSWHKTLGITMLGLVILRLIIRFTTKIPPMPQGSNIILNYISKMVHWALYLFMFIMPLSGYIMSSASQRHFKWFFDIDVPLLISKNAEIASNAHNLHTTAPYILVAFIVLHFLGALKHLIINRENILKRIW